MTEFGVLLPRRSGAGPDLGFAHVAGLAAAAEASGFGSVWVRDPCPGMVHPEARARQLEAYTLLGALAARTSRVHLGALVSDITCRHPSILAKMVTTLDIIAGGRAVLGLGSPPVTSHEVSEPDDPGDRYGMLDEAVQICRAMFAHDEVSFAGRHFELEHARNLPRPPRPGGPRILIGGDENRMLPLIARRADLCSVTGDAGTVARTVGELRRLCGEIGRDPAEVGVTWLAPCTLTSPEGPPGTDGARGTVDEPFDAAIGAIVGPTDRIAAAVDGHLATGVDGVIFSFESVDADTIGAVGTALGLAAR